MHIGRAPRPRPIVRFRSHPYKHTTHEARNLSLATSRRGALGRGDSYATPPGPFQITHTVGRSFVAHACGVTPGAACGVPDVAGVFWDADGLGALSFQ